MITGSGPKGRIVFEGLSGDGPAPQICHLRLELQVLFLLCTFVLFLLCTFVLFFICVQYSEVNVRYLSAAISKVVSTTPVAVGRVGGQ